MDLFHGYFDEMLLQDLASGKMSFNRVITTPGKSVKRLKYIGVGLEEKKKTGVKTPVFTTKLTQTKLRL